MKKQVKRFPSFWDKNDGKIPKISSKSNTVPNMTYTVREILERSKAGKVIRGISNPLYSDKDMPRVNDLSDIDMLRKEQRIATDRSLKLKAREERLKREAEIKLLKDSAIEEYKNSLKPE